MLIELLSTLNCTLESIICVQAAAMSTYPNVKFLTSAAEAHQLAPDVGREIAFAGRSNSGKSTAINAVTQRTGLARVSRTPGRTQLINFFEVAPERRLVDLPGYGFAKVPERVRVHWLQLMEHYFNVRESLVGLILIVDSRRGLGTQDAGMLEWVLAKDRSAHVLLTKADKLNRRDAQKVLRETAAACSDTAVTAQLFSAHAKEGLDELRRVMDGWLNGP
jgi:GTP-binding protein